MNTTDIVRAAYEYIEGFDSPDPIEAIARHGTSEEDDYCLTDAYGEEDANSIALEIQRQCQQRIA